MTSKHLELNCSSPWTVVLKVRYPDQHQQQDQDLLEMQILGLPPRHTGSENLGVGPVFCVLTKPPGDWCSHQFESCWSRKQNYRKWWEHSMVRGWKGHGLFTFVHCFYTGLVFFHAILFKWIKGYNLPPKLMVHFWTHRHIFLGKQAQYPGHVYLTQEKGLTLVNSLKRSQH